MITLAIETSCDETAVCLLETNTKENSGNYKILGNLILSQIALHREFGGVFPIMAKREHSKHLIPLIEKLLKEAHISQIPLKTSGIPRDKVATILKEKEPELLTHLLGSSLMGASPAIDRIAVTKGPGLEPALWVGVNCARALHAIWSTPVVAVNHMEGHIFGSLLPHGNVDLEKMTELKSLHFPALALLISGGHTELVLMKAIGDYSILGKTKDDAVGEAFDKVARMLGFPYPGGPEISVLAEDARKNRIGISATKVLVPISLPRPMLKSPDLDFSFSGLKTAVLYLVRELGGLEKIDSNTKKAIALEFEESVTEVLITKTEKALQAHDVRTLIIGGGVIANTYIQHSFKKLAAKYAIPLYLPPTGVSGDNALMIGIAGAISGSHIDKGDIGNLTAKGNLSL
jgi:N6-L-threonylcarbamoyladenine synthase